MRLIISNVGDLQTDQRLSLEAIVGHKLHDGEQVIIQVVSPGIDQEPTMPPLTKASRDALRLPDWCNVYEGLTDDEIADLEKVILQRADLTRD